MRCLRLLGVAVLFCGLAGAQRHSLDTAEPYGKISLSELLRGIQLYNFATFHCEPGTEDGYALGDGAHDCGAHALDYNPQDWDISLSELLRGIQFYSFGEYYECLSAGSEDGFCPGVPSEGEGEGEGELKAVWRCVFEPEGNGALYSVWGSGPSDVFVVGGSVAQGWVYHYNGANWQKMAVPAVPQLIWVFGFGPDDVYADGLDGTVLHYDGTAWSALTSGTTEDLWGIWGSSPNDLWFVGGDTTPGAPVILHYNGQNFTPVAAPQNDRDATSLFKVWGIGSKLFAVGSAGLIIQYNGSQWAQVPAGAAANDDLVTLWGTSENQILAVGGRSNGLVSTYDGQSWTTKNVAPVPGLSGVFMLNPDEAVVVGQNGYVGHYTVSTGVLASEGAPTTAREFVHAVWGDGAGHTYAVGTRFNSVSSSAGFLLRRTMEPVTTP